MENDVVLQVNGLSKSFPGVKALDRVSLAIRRGEVHALLGENGAGKSTLVKILAGLLAPDEGEILVRGEPVRFKSPHQALQRGIAMIHQELLVFPDLSVAENILMGQEPASRFGWIDRRAMEHKAKSLLEQLQIELSPSTRLRNLSVAERQTVVIAKALAYDPQVIIMDEPTSAISAREIEALLGVIRALKTRGVAIIYISHKLEEVFKTADTISVLRDGQHIATCAARDATHEQLIRLMVGRELRAMSHPMENKFSEPALEVRGLSRHGKFHNISFQLFRGEVLGLAGLVGAGRTDVVQAIYGLAPADAGEILAHGRPIRVRSPRDAIANRIAYVSEDRKEYGLILKMSVKHNITLASLRQHCRGAFIDSSVENRVAQEQIQRLRIKTSSPNQEANFLSGGNQQKVVLAKALLTEPDILLLDEPTRGIDIAAKMEIYELIRRLAQGGMSILLVSSELPELLLLADRILVMRQGRISVELKPRLTTQEEILSYAMPVPNCPP